MEATTSHRAHSVSPRRGGRAVARHFRGGASFHEPDGTGSAAVRQARRGRRRRRRLLVALGILLAAIALAIGGLLFLRHASYADETTTPQGEAIVRACYEVPSPGENLCAAWVSQVYEKALGRYPTGNANDMYEQLASTDRAELEPGMALAVSTHPHTEAGRQYGHIGIYLGGGLVMDNVGEIRTTPLEWWLRHYGATVPVRWGWL